MISKFKNYGTTVQRTGIMQAVQRGELLFAENKKEGRTRMRRDEITDGIKQQQNTTCSLSSLCPSF